MNKFLVLIVLFPVIVSADFIRTSSGKEVKLGEAPKIEKSEAVLRGDFRNADWGDTKKRVKEEEVWDLIGEEEERLGYHGKLLGLDAIINYTFVEGRLVRANYFFKIDHANRNLFIDDYESVREMLNTKYGEVESGKFWKNDLYKDIPDDWGMAVAVGHLVLQSKWETYSTEILLTLDGDNYEMNLGVQYSSKRLGFLEDKKTLSDTLEHF